MEDRALILMQDNYPGFLLGIGPGERPFIITLQAERREGKEYNL